MGSEGFQVLARTHKDEYDESLEGQRDSLWAKTSVRSSALGLCRSAGPETI
jgi:hypothetical protein